MFGKKKAHIDLLVSQVQEQQAKQDRLRSELNTTQSRLAQAQNENRRLNAELVRRAAGN